MFIKTWALATNSFQEVEDNISYSMLNEEVVCSDLFDRNQCLFMEKAMRIVVNKFEKRIENDESELKDTQNQLKEIKLKYDALEKQVTKECVKEKTNIEEYTQDYQSRRDLLMPPFKGFDQTLLQQINDKIWSQKLYLEERGMINGTKVKLLKIS